MLEPAARFPEPRDSHLHAGGGRGQRLLQLRASIAELDPADALASQVAGAVLIDVREADEVARGSPTGALRLNRGFLELRIESIVPDYGRQIIIMCNGGAISLFAADSLQRMGYRRVVTVAGGFPAWQMADLPWEFPPPMRGEERRGGKRADQDRERYGRHLAMPEIGAAGQEKLLASKVLLVGLGGLGCPAALYLAAAGVGQLGVVDDDRVERGKLHREILHTDRRIGQLKVESGRASLAALNPGIRIETYAERLDDGNVHRLFAGYDLVVDGSDNLAAAYLVNDACVSLGIPNVHGSARHFAGQVTVFWPGYDGRRGPCFRCLHPAPPAPEPADGRAAMMGFVPGLIGLLEAVEAIKLLLGLGDPLIGRVLRYEALPGRFVEEAADYDPACACCGSGRNS